MDDEYERKCEKKLNPVCVQYRIFLCKLGLKTRKIFVGWLDKGFYPPAGLASLGWKLQPCGSTAAKEWMLKWKMVVENWWKWMKKYWKRMRAVPSVVVPSGKINNLLTIIIILCLWINFVIIISAWKPRPSNKGNQYRNWPPWSSSPPPDLRRRTSGSPWWWWSWSPSPSWPPWSSPWPAWSSSPPPDLSNCRPSRLQALSVHKDCLHESEDRNHHSTIWYDFFTNSR